MIKPKKKIFVNSEEEVVRFVDNLSLENILEKQEIKLVKSALKFDDLEIREVLVPKKKTICLNTGMTNEEIKMIYLKYSFTHYPVIDEKKRIIGLFNMKYFCQLLIKNEIIDWRKIINKNVIYFSFHNKLHKSLTKMRVTGSRLAIVKEKDKFIGIVGFLDVLSPLIGQIRKKA
ncbi:CBS domain-containing protein [endosymbiont GvMRE of Glomus versiforme]|uniref:CBS domain-containing protein n=1 Tax=endosymbiont GvMRE of Glomus versiforme TaxID=2039283 RepID=UPI0011C433E1|nr:CBS domain-containing protein [endosymbiont GvMRE of Glomus versiforme]